MSHKHLTASERDRIAEMLAQNKKQSDIARCLRRSASTISRELRRNRTPAGYLACAAHTKALTRKRGRPSIKMENPKIAAAVKAALRQDHSPELITGRLALLDGSVRIGKQAIYDWIHRERNAGRKWHRYLPRRGKSYTRRCSGCFGKRRVKTIHERPACVESRTRIGDWEGDTLEGRKGGGAVVTLVERRSRYTVLCPVADRSAARLNEAVRRQFAWQRKFPRLTLTVDCGGEFADGRGLEEAFHAAVYFADPHSPWQKGAVEQVNGLLRRYLPKGFDRAEAKVVELAQERLNHRPRKCLGFRTPHEVLFDVTPA